MVWLTASRLGIGAWAGDLRWATPTQAPALTPRVSEAWGLRKPGGCRWGPEASIPPSYTRGVPPGSGCAPEQLPAPSLDFLKGGFLGRGHFFRN